MFSEEITYFQETLSSWSHLSLGESWNSLGKDDVVIHWC